MIGFLKNRWLLFLILIVFIIYKIPHLYYPYYWDESWVYAPAVLLMALHGPSLLPNAIDVNFSKGHPLFFHALFSVWIRMFGQSHFSMHLFSLLISLALIVTLYEVALKLFNKRVAMASALFLVLNIEFYTSASFVLPDMLIALFTLLSFYFYASGKYLPTALFLTLLLFTKESGLVAAVVIGADAGLSLFNKLIPPKKRLLRCLSVFVPLCLVAVFFVIQKKTFGWYLYPAHTNAINTDLGHLIYYFRSSLAYLFHTNHEQYMFFIPVIFSVLAAIKQRSIKYLFILLPAVFIFLLDLGFHFTEFILSLSLVLFLLSLAISVFALGYFRYYTRTAQQKFVVLSVVFWVGYVCFSSINFFESRYLSPVVIISLLLIPVFFDLFISRSYPALFYPALVTITGIGLFLFYIHRYDSYTVPFDRMIVQQRVVDYFERNNYYDRSICCISYIEEQHLENPATGFLHSAKTFKKAGGHITNNTEFIVFDNIEPDWEQYETIRNDSAFHLAYRKAKGDAWAEIYQRN